TAYRSFGGEVEASSTPTICRLSDSRRHHFRAIAAARSGLSAAKALHSLVLSGSADNPTGRSKEIFTSNRLPQLFRATAAKPATPYWASTTTSFQRKSPARCSPDLFSVVLGVIRPPKSCPKFHNLQVKRVLRRKPQRKRRVALYRV